jgi:serine protease Do
VNDETPTPPDPTATRTMTERLESPPPPPAPESSLSPWPPATHPVRDHSARMHHGVIAAIVAAIVGALAAGGLFVLTDDDTTVQSSSNPAVVSRPSRTIEDDLDVAAIIAKAEPAIVTITTGEGPGTGNGGAGTGFVITADGFIVTNNHVVEGESQIQVAFTNGDSLSADIVGRDPSVDLAVLKVEGDDLPTVELGDSEAVQVGDEVVAIGNALALEGGLSVTRGIISGTDRTVGPTDAGSTLVGMLQTDAAINPGNSGGPLLDAQGRVVGVNTAIDTRGQNIGFAIPISRAEPTIGDLRAGRRPAFLGVSTQNVTPALARELDLSVNEGAYVEQVTPGSPAAEAGIEEGDVILRIGDDEIRASADVLTAVRTHRPGNDVEVVLDRDGDRVTVNATLTTRPDVE